MIDIAMWGYHVAMELQTFSIELQLSSITTKFFHLKQYLIVCSIRVIVMQHEVKITFSYAKDNTTGLAAGKRIYIL